MTFKNIGVFMDHIEARILEPGKIPAISQVVRSITEGRLRVEGQGADGIRLGNFRFTNNEHHKHNLKQDELHRYFSEIAEALIPYDSIFIFGPTTARNEFANFLRRNKQFKGKNIAVDKTNYLTDSEIEKHIKDFFFPGRLRNKLV